MRQWMKLALLGLFSSALIGCGGDDDNDSDLSTNGGKEQQTQLRVLHGAAAAPPVDVLLDGEVVLSDVAYREGSGYLPVEPGSRDLRINPAGEQSSVIQTTQDFAENTAYSLLALASETGDIDPLLLEDDTTAPDTGNVRVRVVHGSPDAPAVDVFVTEPNVGLADATPTLTNVTFREASEFLEVPAGTYQIRIRPTDQAGGDTPSVYDSGPVALQEGSILTLVALPTPGNTQGIGLVALTSDEQNPVFPLANVQETRVRAVHAVPNAPPVNVLVGDSTIVSGLEYAEATGYLNTISGSPQVQVNPTGATDAQSLIDTTAIFETAQPYTMIALGSQPGATALVLQDQTAGPSAQDALVRIVHAADQVGAVDVYITPPDSELGQATPVASAVTFQDASEYLNQQPGDYRIRITPTGTQDVVYDSGQITLDAGDVLTVIALPATGGTSPVRLLALSNSPTQASFAIPDVNARVRAVHASPDAPPVDVLVNGEVAVSDLAFGQASDYAQVTATDGPTFTINQAGTENTVLEASPALMRGTDYTLMAVNNLADIEPLLLTDDQRPPEPGNAKVRVVHASPDAPAVDILVDGEVVASDVAFKDSTDYLQLSAGDHTVSIREASTDMEVFQTTVTVEEGGIYTVVAIGRLADLQAQVLTDN